MTDYNLGTAKGTIEIEYNGNGATQASRDLRGVGASAEDAAARTSKASGRLAAAGAVIAAGMGLAVKSAASFEKQLSAVAAVSGATEEEMEQVRTKALQLGKDTSFSASESAAAIEELVKAGVSVADVMDGAADATVALAAAGEVSMPEAASIASNAMNQFGLAAKDLPRVADAIAGAANASAIDVADFGYSLSQAGAVANLAGATFDDTATAIALMGNAGIKGSDAGTSLKSMLSNLQPTTEKQKDLMYELGLATRDGTNAFYDAEGSLKSMSDIAGLLQGSMKGLTKQQQQMALETLFGSDAIRAAAIMADNGSKGFDAMAESMSKVSAADVAATRLDNLDGSIEQLKGSVETLMIQIGTPLLGTLRSIVDGVNVVVSAVLSLPQPILDAAGMFASMLSAGLLLAAGFLKLKAAFTAFRAGALLITGPIGLAVALIAGLVAAFVYFYKTNAKFRAFVQQMGAVIKDALGAAIEWLVPQLQKLGEFLVEVFQASLPYIQRFGSLLADAFIAALPTIKAVGRFLQELAGIFMDEVVPAVAEAASGVIDGLVGAFDKVWPAIPPIIDGVKDFVSSLIELGEAIVNGKGFQFLIDVIKVVAKLMVGTLIPLFVRLQGIFLKVFVQVLGNALKQALGVLRGALNIISGVIKVFTGLLTGDWRKAWTGVKQILRGAVGVLSSILKGFMANAGAIIKGIASAIVAGVRAIPGLLRGLGGLFAAAGRFIIGQFVQGISNAAGLISGIAGNIWDLLKGLLNGAITQVNRALEFDIKVKGIGVSVNPPDIPPLATGGVTTGPMLALIGDNVGGKEAVVPLDQLWRQLDKVYQAGKTSLQDAESRSGGRSSGSGTNGGAGRARLLEGRLSIDRSGRAYIRGIAEDVADGNERFATTHGRMGGR